MFTKQDKTELLNEIGELRGEIQILTAERNRINEASKLQTTIDALNKKIGDLKIQESQITEQHEREKREVEHKVGLVKKSSEFEIDAAKREAVLEVRETQLDADREAFTKQMDFVTERFTQEVSYLKDEIIKTLVAALPNVNYDIERSIGAPTRKARAS
jgi:TolA-binding protein